MNSKLTRMLLGGFSATLVMSLMMRFVAPMLIGQPIDIAIMLGTMMGGFYALGLSIHIILGVIVFPFIYVILLRQILPGNVIVKGFLYGIFLWLIAETFIMPITDAGFFMLNVGGAKAAFMALMGHIAYGGILSVIAGKSEPEATSFAQHALNK